MNPSDLVHRSFSPDYARYLARCIGNDYHDNYDWRRFGPQPPVVMHPRQRITGPIKDFLKRAGFVRADRVKDVFDEGLALVEPYGIEFEWLYRKLEDEESRELLVQLLAYRALGHRRVRLPLNNPTYRALREHRDQKAGGDEAIDAQFMGRRLYKKDMRESGYPVEIFCGPLGALNSFILQQYRCPTASGAIEAEPGDTVIDAGGCYGDTALYFAVKVGARGKVASFEFLPHHLEIFRRNLDLNPDIAPRVALIPHPVWSSSDKALYVHVNGPGTTVSETPPTPEAAVVHTLSIDDLLGQGTLDRVDFIKMDIEGAELAALKGAEHTLRRFRPKLGISVYHRLSDFWQVPQYLDSLDLGYKFYMRHFTIHAEETVLFARATVPGQ